MVFLLFLLGVIAIAAGVMGLTTGILPIAETTFGIAALVSASIAVTGGLVLLGMAAAVAEVRRVQRALTREMRQDRVPDRVEGGAAARREPRLTRTQPASGNVADVIPARFDTPEEEARARPLAGSGAELRGAPPVAARSATEPPIPFEVPEPRFSEPAVPQPAPAPELRTSERRFAEPPPAPPPSPEPRISERRFAEPPAPVPDPRISQDRFAEPPPLQPSAAPEPRISEQRRSEPPALQPPPIPEPRRYPEPAVPQPPPVPEPRTSERRYTEPPVPSPPPMPAAPLSEPAIAAPERFDAAGPHHPADDDAVAEGTLPPLAPADAHRSGPRPVRVLKSGVINDVAYTLFSDGTIESKTPTETLHFASIDEFRRHLEGSE